VLYRRAKDEAPDYGTREYWDERYKTESDGTYDWLGDYDRCREHIHRAVGERRDVSILDLGCGNATLLERLYDDGFTDLTGFDISEVAIEAMRKRNEGARPGIKWVVGDALSTFHFPDGAFDLVIDKSTMDAISCDEKRIHRNLAHLTGEVSRVLRDGGTYLVFSAITSIPERALSFGHLDFRIERTDIPVPFMDLSVFAATKGEDANSKYRFRAQEIIAYAEEQDRLFEEQRRKAAEAEEKLHAREKPSTFDILD